VDKVVFVVRIVLKVTFVRVYSFHFMDFPEAQHIGKLTELSLGDLGYALIPNFSFFFLCSFFTIKYSMLKICVIPAKKPCLLS
jgi:hypothetical protein